LHALNFGATAGDYYAAANDEILVILQTESPLGVQNAETIYSLPGVDAIFVGPNDLAANMRKQDGREASKDEFDATMQCILDTGKKVRTPVGLHVQTPEDALRRAAAGWQFIAIGSELRMMLGSAQEIVKKIRPQESTKDVARY
jgi:4-hydroxy-2-oxoheptanedioate aldolase